MIIYMYLKYESGKAPLCQSSSLWSLNKIDVATIVWHMVKTSLWSMSKFMFNMQHIYM